MMDNNQAYRSLYSAASSGPLGVTMLPIAVKPIQTTSWLLASRRRLSIVKPQSLLRAYRYREIRGLDAIYIPVDGADNSIQFYPGLPFASKYITVDGQDTHRPRLEAQS